MTPLPANSTHVMQPLDVAVFAPMKKKWREILDKWRSESKSSASIPKEYFPTLLNRLWNAVSQNVSKNLKSGFKATGLCPYDPSEVLKKIPGTLPENADEVQKTMSQSLIDVLQDLRGSNKEKPVRKRGKKVDPGKQLRSDKSKPTNENFDPAEVGLLREVVAGPLEEPVAGPSGTQTMTVDSSDDDNDDLPLIAVKKTLDINLPLKKQADRKVKKNKDNLCAICFTEWNNYKGADWIRCSECFKWICGICNEESDDPCYVCIDCTNRDFDTDDSLKDKDFCI